MNEKKSKRLRQLVRHLQERGAVEDKSWISYASYPQMDERPMIDGNGKLTSIPWMKGQAILNPGCGRAIYQSMKNRADRNGRGV